MMGAWFEKRMAFAEAKEFCAKALAFYAGGDEALVSVFAAA